MAKELTREEFWQILKKLPEETQNLILSEQTAKDIFDICNKNNVEVLTISKVALLVGHVLMELIPVNEFQNNLEEIGLERKTAEVISEDIQKTIFSQIGKKATRGEGQPSSASDIYREQIE